ncbi:tetratricopeptide repeat protein [Mariniflexile sp. HMF6888]|uniref:tetratricopeptide repeat protein n=1 Tax=Mariniflexile sp. HMF6888 TaxID=3373086 RepID=UPI0037AD0137
MPNLIIFIISVFFLQCKGEDNSDQESAEAKRIRQDLLIEKYVGNCAEKFSYRYQMSEWQHCLDEGLKEDSTVAYLWQQKAMPYFKARKYEVGMKYLDKAVLYNERSWLSYRAFIKCVFAKTYREAIKDFEKCIQNEGNTYVMDHTYQFHIALCNLQLNEFEKAETIFKKDIEEQEQEWGEAHYIDLFYYGISKYEQGKWEEAIFEFDKSLKQYTQFSDAKYYKAICLGRLNRTEEFKSLMIEAKTDKNEGYSINEDNSIYETYPYQIIW